MVEWFLTSYPAKVVEMRGMIDPRECPLAGLDDL